MLFVIEVLFVLEHRLGRLLQANRMWWNRILVFVKMRGRRVRLGGNGLAIESFLRIGGRRSDYFSHDRAVSVVKAATGISIQS